MTRLSKMANSEGTLFAVFLLMGISTVATHLTSGRVQLIVILAMLPLILFCMVMTIVAVKNLIEIIRKGKRREAELVKEIDQQLDELKKFTIKGAVPPKSSIAMRYADKIIARSPQGVLPYGFERMIGGLVPNPTELQIIDKICAMRDENIPYGKIALELKKEGARTRRREPFSLSSVTNLYKQVIEELNRPESTNPVKMPSPLPPGKDVASVLDTYIKFVMGKTKYEGPMVYGFRLERDGPEIDTYEMGVLQDIFEQHDKGRSFKAIARDFNKRGLTNRKGAPFREVGVASLYRKVIDRPAAENRPAPSTGSRREVMDLLQKRRDEGWAFSKIAADFRKRGYRSIHGNPFSPNYLSMMYARRNPGQQRQQTHGKPRYGTRIIGGEYVDDPQEKLIVKRIGDLRDQGLSLLQIGRRLEREGVKSRSGGLFSASMIESILLYNFGRKRGN